jgi:hypothetical protein
MQKATFETFLYSIGQSASAVYNIDGVPGVIFQVTRMLVQLQTANTLRRNPIKHTIYPLVTWI